MKVQIWNEIFTIRCNRFKFQQTVVKNYPIFTSNQNVIKNIKREVELVPDLQQFKRYFVTLLIHNLDSQIADNIAFHVKNCIPIHDAFIAHPNNVKQAKELYTNKLRDIYDERNTILKNYFDSIGIKEELNLKVNKLNNGFSFKPLETCLK